MPNQSRQIFILSRYQNTPNKKIAEQLGISVKSVEFHITKALKILRTELKRLPGFYSFFKNNRIFVRLFKADLFYI